MAAIIPKAIHSLIIDAGPIIKNEPSVSTLLGQADTVFTIPAVIDEIRDAVTRARIESTLLPFLTLRSPRTASIKVISDFARRTGDLEVLSRPDIHLMALAYELECERNQGDWRLRSVPGQKRLNDAPPGSSKSTAFAEVPLNKETGGTEQPQLAVAIGEMSGMEPSQAAPTNMTTAAWGTQSSDHTNGIMAIGGQLECTRTTSGEEQLEQNIAETLFPTTKRASETLAKSDASIEEIEASESEDDDWITPSNLKKYQQRDGTLSIDSHDEPKIMQVATITSDFAMQNVLLRMNLNLLSPSLQRIRQLKTWVLRCHACFQITKDMAKQFCPRCGKPTLLRTSCSTDKDGNFKVHLKKNMQWNTRGNIYSIPKPIAGSSNGKMVNGGGKGGWGQGLILAEDQKEYVNAMTSSRRKKEKDLMDEDYLPSILTGDRGRAGGRPRVGAGKNVNSKKRH